MITTTLGLAAAAIGDGLGDGDGETSGDGDGENPGDGSGEMSGDGNGENPTEGDGSAEGEGPAKGDGSAEDAGIRAADAPSRPAGPTTPALLDRVSTDGMKAAARKALDAHPDRHATIKASTAAWSHGVERTRGTSLGVLGLMGRVGRRYLTTIAPTLLEASSTLPWR